MDAPLCTHPQPSAGGAGCKIVAMTSFANLGLPRDVVSVLNRQGITEPFPIQEAAIPDALAGKDVLGRGPTGSGKTFTFGLPMLARLAGAPSTPGAPRGLVLAPTRELAAHGIADRNIDLGAVKRTVTRIQFPLAGHEAVKRRRQALLSGIPCGNVTKVLLRAR